ncbi:carboxymuconolactone decarboxylase family protein [Salmonirosea aquatica]|uniref:Carboxymuconolactone decarboxylase family protein n=1 Tax=Salmonirosea aquatica TaxID=2654236 RepID=A0A7C9F2D7_9BACT|nr:carboxymuconolactone decarboxylase family protein [Cytophagaceae bacterium SJW1-29]
MQSRVKIEQAKPEVWKAMYGLAGSLSKSTLTPIQKSLIKIRASQINSCAYCINMHTKEALKAGDTQQRIFLIGVWAETNLFTEEEKAILSLTEEVTLIHQHGISDSTYAQAEKYFSPETIAEIIMSAVEINAWNRIAISTHLSIAH